MKEIKDEIPKGKIKVNCHNIQFLSPIGHKKVAFVIWEEDFERVIQAIKKSKQMKKEYEQLDKKFNYEL